MGKIFCLMGKSASGKDAVYRELIRMEDLALKEVVLYTTRPIRSGETDGVTYHFTTEENVQHLLRSGKVIEIRTYQTVHGPWSYLTVDDGQFDLDHSDYLLIGTLESFEKIRAYFGEDRVCGIYLWVEDGTRLLRAISREISQTNPKYAELCRRYLADEEDFSEEKIGAAKVDTRIENEDFDRAVKAVTAFIRSKLG